MRTFTMALTAFACSVSALGQAASGTAKVSGTCNVVSTGSDNNLKIDIKDCGIGTAQGDKLVGLVRRLTEDEKQNKQDLSVKINALSDALTKFLATTPTVVQQNCFTNSGNITGLSVGPCTMSTGSEQKNSLNGVTVGGSGKLSEVTVGETVMQGNSTYIDSFSVGSVTCGSYIVFGNTSRTAWDQLLTTIGCQSGSADHVRSTIWDYRVRFLADLLGAHLLPSQVVSCSVQMRNALQVLMDSALDEHRAIALIKRRHPFCVIQTRQ